MFANPPGGPTTLVEAAMGLGAPKPRWPSPTQMGTPFNPGGRGPLGYPRYPGSPSPTQMGGPGSAPPPVAPPVVPPWNGPTYGTGAAPGARGVGSASTGGGLDWSNYLTPEQIAALRAALGGGGGSLPTWPSGGPGGPTLPPHRIP